MEPHKDLKTLLDEALELRNVNHEKLSQLTGIPERYLWAIQNLDVTKLPASPYVRGYIKKISEILHLNHDELWEMYKIELNQKQSGAYDKLPGNRFAIKQLSKKNLYLSAFGVLLLVYLIFNLNRLTGEPNLLVTSPAEPIISTPEDIIKIGGQMERRDKLTINGEEIFINPDGTFSQEYSLQPGLNTIEFKATRLLGGEKTIVKQVLFQPTTTQQLTPDFNE